MARTGNIPFAGSLETGTVPRLFQASSACRTRLSSILVLLKAPAVSFTSALRAPRRLLLRTPWCLKLFEAFHFAMLKACTNLLASGTFLNVTGSLLYDM